jgi:hypothetical protein
LVAGPAACLKGLAHSAQCETFGQNRNESVSMSPYDPLHAACAALGTRLFTVTIIDEGAGVARRAFTSHPVEYPVQGTKPLTQDGWHDHCIAGRQTFVANTVPEFATYFFDHALITSLGLGSCINIPVFAGDGPVLGTVNLLAEEHHFAPARLAAYQALVATHHAALTRAMTSA